MWGQLSFIYLSIVMTFTLGLQMYGVLYAYTPEVSFFLKIKPPETVPPLNKQ